MNEPVKRSSKQPREFLYLKSVAACPYLPNRSRHVVVYADAAGKQEIHRFEFGKLPRMGCRQIRIPWKNVHNVFDLYKCKWLAAPAWVLSVATHRYPTTVHSGAGYFNDTWRYLVAPDAHEVMKYARSHDAKIDLTHIQHKVTGVRFDGETERMTGIEWRPCALPPQTTASSGSDTPPTPQLTLL